MACLTSAIEPLRAANEITGQRAFGWCLIGEAPGAVRSSADVRFDADMTLADIASDPGRGGLDHLIFLGSPTSRFVDARASDARVRRLARHGLAMGGFSGGVFPLMRSGVMEGHRVSVHWCYEAAFKAEFPDHPASQSVIVRDRRRVTASGAGAVFDLMLHLIEERLGRDTMTEVACWFQHPFVRDEDARQKVPVQRQGGTDDLLPDRVQRAIRIFADHVEDPIHIADVAAAVDLSARHLERSFKQATGQSPLRFYRLLRLRKARQQVLYSTQTITEIARSVGYATSTTMTRHYAQAFGVNPADERRSLTGLRGLAGAEAPGE